jgi:hypothetical protein
VSSCTFCAIAAGHKTDQPVVAADEHTVALLDCHRLHSEALPGAAVTSGCS